MTTLHTGIGISGRLSRIIERKVTEASVCSIQKDKPSVSKQNTPQPTASYQEDKDGNILITENNGYKKSRYVFRKGLLQRMELSGNSIPETDRYYIVTEYYP